MAVSTIASALGKTGGINEESQKVINRINGHKTAEEMIGEYFGLRKEVIYSDDGQSVIDMVNEFRDPIALKRKKVRFVPYFAEKGMTREMFDRAVPKEFQPNEAEFEKKPVTSENGNEPAVDAVAERDDAPESQPALPASGKRTRRAKG